VTLDVVRQAGECGVVTGDIDLMDLLVHGDAGPDLRKIQLVAADLDGGLEGRWVGGAHRWLLRAKAGASTSARRPGR
jgi:hypothetical protein